VLGDALLQRTRNWRGASLSSCAARDLLSPQRGYARTPLSDDGQRARKAPSTGSLAGRAETAASAWLLATECIVASAPARPGCRAWQGRDLRLARVSSSALAGLRTGALLLALLTSQRARRGVTVAPIGEVRAASKPSGPSPADPACCSRRMAREGPDRRRLVMLVVAVTGPRGGAELPGMGAAITVGASLKSFIGPIVDRSARPTRGCTGSCRLGGRRGRSRWG
jgi:hypothetical protein